MLIIGFGNTEFEGNVSPILQEVESNVVSSETCVAAYERADVSLDSERMLCTGVYGGGKESCQGIVRCVNEYARCCQTFYLPNECTMQETLVAQSFLRIQMVLWYWSQQSRGAKDVPGTMPTTDSRFISLSHMTTSCCGTVRFTPASTPG
jgi:Trypsin